MIYEKIVVRENGDKVLILVNLYVNNIDNGHTYDIDIKVCLKNKRKFVKLEFDDYLYRMLSMEDRATFRYKEYLKVVSEQELLDAKIELWNLISPIKNAVIKAPPPSRFLKEGDIPPRNH